MFSYVPFFLIHTRGCLTSEATQQLSKLESSPLLSVITKFRSLDLALVGISDFRFLFIALVYYYCY